MHGRSGSWGTPSCVVYRLGDMPAEDVSVAETGGEREEKRGVSSGRGYFLNVSLVLSAIVAEAKTDVPKASAFPVARIEAVQCMGGEEEERGGEVVVVVVMEPRFVGPPPSCLSGDTAQGSTGCVEDACRGVAMLRIPDDEKEEIRGGVSLVVGDVAFLVEADAWPDSSSVVTLVSLLFCTGTFMLPRSSIGVGTGDREADGISRWSSPTGMTWKKTSAVGRTFSLVSSSSLGCARGIFRWGGGREGEATAAVVKVVVEAEYGTGEEENFHSTDGHAPGSPSFLRAGEKKRKDVVSGAGEKGDGVPMARRFHTDGDTGSTLRTTWGCFSMPPSGIQPVERRAGEEGEEEEVVVVVWDPSPAMGSEESFRPPASVRWTMETTRISKGYREGEGAAPRIAASSLLPEFFSLVYAKGTIEAEEAPTVDRREETGGGDDSRWRCSAGCSLLPRHDSRVQIPPRGEEKDDARERCDSVDAERLVECGGEWWWWWPIPGSTLPSAWWTAPIRFSDPPENAEDASIREKKKKKA